MADLRISDALHLWEKCNTAVICASGKVLRFEREAGDESRQKDIPGSSRSDSEERVRKLRAKYKRLADAATCKLYETLRKRTVG